MNTGFSRVRTILETEGLGERVYELMNSAHTAAEAALALGVGVAEIAKCIVFRANLSNRAITVVGRGDRRVNLQRLGDHLGEPVERAEPEWVRQATGYPIGGVSSVGQPPDVVVLIDGALERFPWVYAAAGHPHAVFRVTPMELIRLSRGIVVNGLSD